MLRGPFGRTYFFLKIRPQHKRLALALPSIKFRFILCPASGGVKFWAQVRGQYWGNLLKDKLISANFLLKLKQIHQRKMVVQYI